MNAKEIKINWKGPYRMDENDKLYEKFTQTVYDVEKVFNGVGLYQVYGYHPVYGSNVLLYIGITTKQSFSKRLKDRVWKYDNFDVNNIEIYLGKLIGETKKIHLEDEQNMIKNAEALLIYTHNPAKNSSNVLSVDIEQVKNIRVQNYGNLRSLMPEVSGNYWLGGLKNYTLIDKLSEQKDLNIKKAGYGFYITNQDDIWIGIYDRVWEEEGFPLVVGFDGKIWQSGSKKQVKYDDQIDRFFYFELDVSDKTVDNMTLDTIFKKIEQIKIDNKITKK